MTASLSKEGLKSVPLSVQMHLLIIRVAACGHPWSSLNLPENGEDQRHGEDIEGARGVARPLAAAFVGFCKG